MAYLSYLGSHWALFLIVVLAVVVLGAASWFLKNWKLAAAAIVLVIAGLAYQSSNIDGYKRRLAEDNAAVVKTLQTRLLALSMTQALDAQRAQADAFLNSKLDALSRETPQNSAGCLSLAAARRVRAIRGSQPLATTLPASRYSGLLQRRSAAP